MIDRRLLFLVAALGCVDSGVLTAIETTDEDLFFITDDSISRQTPNGHVTELGPMDCDGPVRRPEFQSFAMTPDRRIHGVSFSEAVYEITPDRPRSICTYLGKLPLPLGLDHLTIQAGCDGDETIYVTGLADLETMGLWSLDVDTLSVETVCEPQPVPLQVEQPMLASDGAGALLVGMSIDHSVENDVRLRVRSFDPHSCELGPATIAKSITYSPGHHFVDDAAWWQGSLLVTHTTYSGLGVSSDIDRLNEYGYSEPMTYNHGLFGAPCPH